MARTIQTGGLVRDQADFYLPGGGVSRVSGVGVSQLELSLFVNNGLAAWTLADGSAVPDSSISAGTVYFNEISGASGFYSVRFFPDRVGFWRLILRNTSLSTETIREFDLTPTGPIGPPNGLTASFL